MCRMQHYHKHAKMDGNPPVSKIKETSEVQKVERMKKQHNINKNLEIPLSVWGATH